ncbi:MAG: M23 family metallopeptidase, partial [Mucinivorans sp.]
MKRISLIILLCCGLSLAQAQRRSTYVAPKIEELPRKPMDTITTADPDTKVIIFSNNTWEFYHPKLRAQMQDLDVYRYNWDTVGLFAYRNIELSDIPKVVELRLVDNLSDFCPPIVGTVYSKYGPRGRRNHNGTDIPLRIGEPIMSAFDGKVRYASMNYGGYGNLVIVRHPNGLESWHGHLSRINCHVGDYVRAGQVIGFGGSTGRSRGPHLHYELRYKDQTFDPEYLIDFENGRLRYQTFALEKSFFNIHSRASETLEDDDYDDAMAGTILAAADD